MSLRFDANDQVGNLKDKAAQVQELAGKANQAKDLLANAGPLKDKVFGMKDNVTETLSAVKSGDFTTAQSNFGTLQQSWNEIQGDKKYFGRWAFQNSECPAERFRCPI